MERIKSTLLEAFNTLSTCEIWHDIAYYYPRDENESQSIVRRQYRKNVCCDIIRENLNSYKHIHGVKNDIVDLITSGEYPYLRKLNKEQYKIFCAGYSIGWLVNYEG